MVEISESETEIYKRRILSTFLDAAYVVGNLNGINMTDAIGRSEAIGNLPCASAFHMLHPIHEELMVDSGLRQFLSMADEDGDLSDMLGDVSDMLGEQRDFRETVKEEWRG
jgi:hypothetical protein